MGRKPVKRPPNPLDDGPMLKMKELAEATGISKTTILYYVSEKLLPKPVKTSPNMAFYPYSMVERLQLIQQLKTQYRFSLSQIRTILRERDKGHDVETLIEFNKEVFHRNESEAMDRMVFGEACDLNEEQINTSISLKLIIPNVDGSFNSTDLAAGKRLKGFLELGMRMEDLSFYPRLAEEIVDLELAGRQQLIREKSYDEALNLTLRITQGARFFREYITERIFQLKASRQPLLSKNDVTAAQDDDLETSE